MPKFAKRFLIGVAALAAVFAVVLLCINLYLQSSGVQQRIRNATLQALGTEVKIRSTSYTPWGGLVLRGLSVPSAAPADPNVIEAEALRIRFSLFPLLRQKFVVTECTLSAPRLLVRQLEDGSWVVPLPPPRTPEIPLTPGAPVGPALKGPSFKAELQRFRLVNGTIVFLDAKTRTVLKLDKSNIDARVAPDQTAKGNFEVGVVEIANAIKPQHIAGPFTWDGKALDLPDIKGDLAGGSLAGKYRLLAGAEPSFTLDVKLDHVLLKQLALDAHVDPGQTDGYLRGTLDLAGDPRSSKSLTGRGRAELISARLQPMDFIVQLGTVIGVEELQLLQLSDAHADFNVWNERVNLDDVVLKSENLILRGKGMVRFNGKLKVEAQLLVNQKLQQQFKGVLGPNFVDSEIPGYKQLPFAITNRIDNPKSDLLEKITGLKIGGDLQGLFNSFFRPSPQKSPDPDDDKDGN